MLVLVLVIVIEAMDYDYEHRFAEHEQEWDVHDGAMKRLQVIESVPIRSRLTEHLRAFQNRDSL